MSRIAVAGRMYSGKTSLAQYLVEHHGWYCIGYTDLLKEWLSGFLTGLGVITTVEDICRDKAKYRVILQELGNLLGFNEGFGVHEAIRRWDRDGRPEPVIFDNVRFDGQFEALADLGFVLVELRVPQELRVHCAQGLGISSEDLHRMDMHFSENAFTPEVTVHVGERSIAELAYLFTRMFGENRRRMVKAQQKRREADEVLANAA